MSAPTVKVLPPPGPSVHTGSFIPPISHPDVPSLFNDAMAVRIAVFVDEQRCSLANEIDEDDARSWHWVAYVLSEARKEAPAATIRLVPVTPLAGHSHAEDVKDEIGRALGPKHERTEIWVGKEAFVKLGRMATVKECRKFGLGRLLVETAIDWLKSNAGEVTRELAAGQEEKTGWNGLVLVHAQKNIERFWASLGFVRDDGMGVWWEEDIEHVGMWRRVS